MTRDESSAAKGGKRRRRRGTAGLSVRGTDELGRVDQQPRGEDRRSASVARIRALSPRRVDADRRATPVGEGDPGGNSRGLIFGFTLGSVMQMLQLERASCLLSVCSGSHEGRISIVDGEVAEAEAGAERGEEALFQILSWQRQRVEMLDLAAPVERRIQAPLAFLLMEAARRQDERSESDEWMTVAGELEIAGLPIDGASDACADALALSPPEGGRAATPDATPRCAPTESVEAESFESLTADIAERLTRIGPRTSLVLQALVDGSTGKALARIEGSASFDGARAVELIHEVVCAELKVYGANARESLENILISLETQYHIVRLLDVERPLYLYLVLDRNRTNLAATLRTLGEIQNDLASVWAQAA